MPVARKLRTDRAGRRDQSLRGLALDRKGGAAKSQTEAVPNSHNPSLLVAPIRAAPQWPKPQYPARFRNLGKRGFPKLRREADALHQRWEAKRSAQMLLTVRPRA